MLAPLLVAAMVSLTPGAPARISIAGGEKTVFRVDVPAESAARIVAAQEGVDIGLTLRVAGSDLPKYGIDMVAGPAGTETSFPPVIPAPQSWDLHVWPALPRAARGEVSITVEIVPASERDRAVAAARQQYQLASDTAWIGDGPSFKKALELYAAAATGGLGAGDIALAAESTYQRARVLDNLGDTPAAIEEMKRALALFRQVGRRDRESRALNRLGDLSRKVGEVVESEAYFKEAIPIANETKDAQCIADLMNNSALLMLVLGRYEEAIEKLEAAIPAAQEIDSSNIETALHHNISLAWRNLGVYDKGIDSQLRAVALSRKNLPVRRVANNLYALAVAYWEAGDRARAEEALRESLTTWEKTDDRPGVARALALLGRIQHLAGEPEKAVENFARAVPLLAEVKNRSGEIGVLIAWAQLEIDRGALDDALLKLDRALELARLIVNRNSEAEALYVRALALQKKGNFEEAIASISTAIEIVETMRGSIARSELRTSYLATVRSYFDLHIELLQRSGQTAAAFGVSEQSRARTLLESLAESASKIRKGVSSELLARERSLQAQVNAKEIYRGQVVAKEGEKSARAVALTKEVARLLDEWKDAKAKVRAASPAYAELRRPEPVTIESVRSLLDADTVLVEYHLGERRSWAWVIDARSIRVHELPPAGKINPLARRFHEQLSSDGTEPDAKPLFEAIWKPLRVRGKRVLIVADGALYYVPFAALSDGGEPLLVKHEIAYLPSASVLHAIRRESRRVGTTAAVFADPVFSKNDARFGRPELLAAARGDAYQRLRFSRKEAEAIVAVAPGSFEAVDFDASKTTLLERDLRKYRILHFAAHGSLDTERPELSGLVLSLVDRNGKPVDGYLRLHEIYNLELDADLVVLSACRTALGKEVYGEGLIGLTRGFMYAGASRVVSTVWNVDDRSSALLMQRFYSAMLTERTAPAAALREAQLALYRQARWKNPHYWAAFALQGEWK
jgi:tetratricopeptide (TPR) repeat protein